MARCKLLKYVTIYYIYESCLKTQGLTSIVESFVIGNKPLLLANEKMYLQKHIDTKFGKCANSNGGKSFVYSNVL